MSTPKNPEKTISDAAVELSLIEIVLGSLLHNLHVPFAGHFLSLNQAYYYSHYLKIKKSRVESIKMLIELSLIISLMKSLSPSFKKLGPMMSISMQGFLYSVGVFLAGIGLLGQILGSMLLSLWAFVQPLISLFVLYGFSLLKAAEYYQELFSKYFHGSLLHIFLLFIIGKMLIAAFIPLLAKKYPPYHFLKLREGLKKKEQKKRTYFYEITRPFFLLSFVFMFLFFYLTESDHILFFVMVARVLSVSFLLFFLMKSKWIKNFVKMKLEKSSYGQSLLRKAELTYLKVLELS